MAGRFAHQAEYFPWGTKGAKPWDYSQECLPGVFEHAAPGKEREHQTEKPVSLMGQIVKIAPPHLPVLDPFMGAATTGAAASRAQAQGSLLQLDSTPVAVQQVMEL
jgi:site-specific DNA-methyltransferase (adenine-specific)